MAYTATLRLPHLPSTFVVHLALFRDLENASFLRQQLLAGNAEYDYALIDASVIVSTTHALAAVFRAANDLINNRLKSRNVHSEIVFALSPNNNIAESFRRFGITDSTINLLAIKLSVSADPTQASVSQHLARIIEGKPVNFCDETISQMTDLARVKKIYKLNPATKEANKRGKSDLRNGASTIEAQSEKIERKELEISILGLMALRGAS